MKSSSRPTLSSRPAGLTALLALALAGSTSLSLQANPISWTGAVDKVWSTGGNWTGGTAPTGDLTTDIAVFNQTTYTRLTDLSASRSVGGLQFGDGTTTTAAWNLTTFTSVALAVGSSGISVNANSGSVTFGNGSSGTSAMRIGASQSWTNNSSNALTVGNVGTGSTLANLANITPFALTLNGSGSGNTVINNVINNGGATGTLALVVNRTGSGSVILSGANTYTGGTLVSAGTLLVNNTTGSGTGGATGAVSVGSTATLGGSGFISGSTTASSGSFLAPGSSSGVVGTLTFTGTLNISGLASGTGGLFFNLNSTAASDKIALTTGALSIGSGVLEFNDFNFTTLGSFGVGTYTLLDTTQSIVGTLGSSLTGTIGGLSAVLSLANSNQDLILTVSAIPEPATYAAFFGVLALGGTIWQRRSAAARSR